MDKLKPCPFCGGVAEVRDCGRIIKKKYREFYTIRCSVCMGTVPRYLPTVAEAIEVWNRRAEDERNNRS